MLSRAFASAALGVSVSVVLQGCGGGGGDSPAPAPVPAPVAPTPPPSTTSTTTTTVTTTSWPFSPRTPGWTLDQAVEELNRMYFDFDATNDTSELGVTLSYAGIPEGDFMDNIFCPGYSPGSHCFDGADPSKPGAAQNVCRLSAAVLNHKVMVQARGNNSVVVPLMGRSIGYIFNQTLVETTFGKCAWIFDGAASANVNQGCGGNAGGGSCDDPNSAFYDMCTNDQETYHHCVADDQQVVQAKCNCPTCNPPVTGGVDPPHHQADAACYYEMPALIVPYDDPESFEPSQTNNIRQSMVERVTKVSDGEQNQWNEVILDERVLIPQIHLDPTHTIVAFFYANGQGDVNIAKQLATNMRDNFQEFYRVSGVPDIPVVALDCQTEFAFPTGPFKKTLTEIMEGDFSDVTV